MDNEIDLTLESPKLSGIKGTIDLERADESKNTKSDKGIETLNLDGLAGNEDDIDFGDDIELDPGMSLQNASIPLRKRKRSNVVDLVFDSEADDGPIDAKDGLQEPVSAPNISKNAQTNERNNGDADFDFPEIETNHFGGGHRRSSLESFASRQIHQSNVDVPMQQQQRRFVVNRGIHHRHHPPPPTHRGHRSFGLSASVRKKLDKIKLRSEQRLPDAPDEIEIAAEIRTKLKAHQLKGTKFMWRRVAAGQEGMGCVLADFMGLGKTLQVISLLHAFHNQELKHLPNPGDRRSLILAPAIVVANWRAECHKWLSSDSLQSLRLKVLESSDTKTFAGRASKLSRWKKRGGVMIMGYEMFRNLVTSKRGSERDRQRIHEALCDPGPHLIVLDEGHRIRKAKSRLTKALERVRTMRRIIMTGYPLQNHLAEYWTMVNFARPKYFGSYDTFKERFETPIVNGQCKDSTPVDVRRARQRAYVLHREITPLVLRRGAKYLYAMLPPKIEWVIQVRMVKLQGELYRAYLRHRAKHAMTGNKAILQAFHVSLMIVNSPDLLFRAVQSSRVTTHERKNTDDHSPEPSTNHLSSASSTSSSSRPSSRNENVVMNAGSDSDIEFVKECQTNTKNDLSWAETLLDEYKPGRAASSGKMIVLMQILHHSIRLNEKVTVFSQSLGTLDAIGHLLKQSNKRPESKVHYHFLRIDGSTPLPHRFQKIARFNNKSDPANIILVSTRAGGEGVNLVGGSRVVLFDCCWNPCHDHEAMCRSHRYGQTKPVYVYRLIGAGTMEKKVYELQLRKESLAKRIVDNDATQRHFSRDDILNEYMSIDAYKNEMNAETKGNDSVGDDQVMERLVRDHSRYMQRWFTQDSMLASDADGMCGEEEYDVAIQEYKQEVAGHFPAARHDIGNAATMYRLQLQQRRKQLYTQNSMTLLPPRPLVQPHELIVQCPFCATHLRIPKDPPRMNYICSCPKCKGSLKPKFPSGPLTGARVFIINSPDIMQMNPSELWRRAAGLGVKFVANLEHCNYVITSVSTVKSMLKLLGLPSLPDGITALNLGWLETCVRIERPVDSAYLHKFLLRTE